MADTLVIQETHGRVGLVRLNRTEVHNALSAALLRDLMDALQALDFDPAIGAMVVTGSDKAFSVGADIKEMAGRCAAQMLEGDPIGAFDRLQSVRKPVVAAVSGWCLGGGCELAMGCDLIVASESAAELPKEEAFGMLGFFFLQAWQRRQIFKAFVTTMVAGEKGGGCRKDCKAK